MSMGFLDRFRKVPPILEVRFPLSYHWAEHWRTLTFDIGEFRSAASYRPGLAMMSFGFALSCFTAMDLSKGGEANAVSFLQQARFTNIYASDDYRHQATATTLGFVFGKRVIRQKGRKVTLIAVGIRGGHYGAEWGSNAKLGESGPHQGFYEASERIHKEFLAYLDAIHPKGPIAVWTVGYSRAGGVAALFAHKLSEGLVEGGASRRFGKAILDLQRIYAYTFAAPKSGERNGDVYSYIHNIINPEDLVPRIPFSSFGFDHYGFEHNLRCTDEQAEELIASFQKDGIDVTMPEFVAMAIDFRHILDPKKRYVEDFSRRDGQTGFLDQMCALFESRITRAAYAKYIQEGMIALSSLVDEQSSSPYEKFLGFLKAIFDGVFEDHGFFSILGKVTSDKTDWKSILEPYVERALDLEPELQDDQEAILLALAAFLHYVAPTKRDLLDLYPTLRDKENAKAVTFAHEPIRYYMLLLSNSKEK